MDGELLGTVVFSVRRTAGQVVVHRKVYCARSLHAMETMLTPAEREQLTAMLDKAGASVGQFHFRLSAPDLADNFALQSEVTDG